MPTITCLNCKSNLRTEDNYCSSCGAHQLKVRLTTKEIFSELFDVIIIWNKDFFKTFLFLIAKPAKVIKYYIEGGRKRYLNPLLYLLFSFFLYLLVISFTDGEIFFISGMKGMTEGYNESYSEAMAGDISMQATDSPPEALNSDAIENLNRFSKFILFLILPLMAYASKLTFRSAKLNYAEHIVINAFLLSQLIIIGVIFIPFNIFVDSSAKILNSVPVIFTLAYLIFCQYQIFKSKFLLSALKSSVFIIFSIFSTVMVFLLIIFIVGSL